MKQRPGGKPIKVALFTPSLAAGGAERITVNIANGLAQRGLDVDLVAAMQKDDFLKDVLENVHVSQIGASRVLTSLPKLAAYLRMARPQVIISAQTHANLVAIWANMLTGKKSRVAVCEHFNLSQRENITENRRESSTPLLAKYFYPHADSIVTVSDGVAVDLAEHSGILSGRIQVIYNPVVDLNEIDRVTAAPNHPWFDINQPPVILGAGRLAIQKSFDHLIQAFSIVKKQLDCRLVILGEGEERPRLEELISRLGLENYVDLHGFEPDPLAYMKHAAVFVLSSAAEGLPTVLIEAMACGVPVVSTDCPSGPAEILDNGRFGSLVAVGDVEAMAREIISVLGSRPDTNPARLRAGDFSFDKGIDRYFELVNKLASL